MYQLFFTSGKVDNAKKAHKSSLVMFKRLYDELLQRGIFIPPSQFETCFVSNAHSEDDADKTVESYNDALRKVKEIL
jgi:glutamate-1-semialdehyde 2,1-aminomutase